MRLRKLSNLRILYLKGIKIEKCKGYRRREIRLQVQWCRCCLKNEEYTHEKWKKYERLKKKVKYGGRYKAQNHTQRTRLKNILEGNLEDQAKLWQQLKFKGESNEITSIKGRDKIIIEAQEIKQEIENMLRKLGKSLHNKILKRKARLGDGREKTDHSEVGKGTQNIGTRRKTSKWQEMSNGSGNILKETSVQEVKQAIKELKCRRAVGLDNIPNEFLLGGGEKLWKCLTLLFNLIIRQGESPQEWCEERIKLLHKGGRKDELDNYRTIAITSNVGKAFTRIIAKRLKNVIEDNKWLEEVQNGFRGNIVRWTIYLY